MSKVSENRFIVKILSSLLVFSLCFSLLPVQSLHAESESSLKEAESSSQETTGDTAGDDTAPEETQGHIDINSVEDLLALSEKCYVDSWSEGKHISLKCNLDLTGVDFKPIPIFSGTFDGGGHIISGFDYTGDGYVTGFFRYIGDTGVVRNLVLQGNVDSDNERECVGSICGINYGVVRGCIFQGTVSGRDTVGGIAGINESTATISDCTVRGRITGYYSTGGIAGINHGAVNNCTNYAGINDDSEWVWEDDEMGGMGIFDSLVSYDDVEFYSGVDTGGIAGFSDGIISRCTNEGTVGYEHTGYNIGGIAGRQSGIISLSVNKGIVYGRKDVGGIAGQMEPFIEIDEAESLRNAIDKLHDLIEKTLDDMQKAKNVVKSDADAMQAYADGAIDTGDELISQITNVVNDDISAINSFTGRMEHVMDMLPPILDHISAAGTGMSGLNNTIKNLTQALDISGKLEDDYFEGTDYRRLTLLSTVGGRLLSGTMSPAENDMVTITAVTDNGYGLVESSLKVKDADGNSVAVIKNADGEYSFIMPKANVTVSAAFAYSGAFLVKSTVGGSVFSTADGSRETCRAVADSGYEFSHFNVDGNRYNGDYSGDNNNEITLDKNAYELNNAAVVVEAVFIEKSGGNYKINCVSGIGGSVYPDKSGAAAGDEVTLTVAARTGYKLKEILAEGVEIRGSVSDADKYIFTMPGHDVKVKVTYAAETDSGSGVYMESSAGGSAYQVSGASEKYTITIIPDSGYTLDSDNALMITAAVNGGDDSAAQETPPVSGGNPEETENMPSVSDNDPGGYVTNVPEDESEGGAAQDAAGSETTRTVALSQLTQENSVYKYVLDPREFVSGNIMVYVNFVEENGSETGSDARYGVTAAFSTGGRVTTSLQSVGEGEKVFITPVAGSGYFLKKLTVSCGGNEIPIVKESDGKQYSFIMPAGEVRVAALFEPIYVILTSNLSGSASCSGNAEGMAVLNVEPDTAYMLERAPAVTDAAGNTVPVSKKQSGSYVYEFDITKGSAPYTVRIDFVRQDKEQAVDTSKDNIKDAMDNLGQVSEDVEKTTDRIQAIITDKDGNIKSWDQLTQVERDELTQEVIKLAELLGNVTDSSSYILSNLAVIYNILAPYASEGCRDALDKIRAATDYVQKMIDSLQAATDGIRGIVNYIYAQPDISFRGFDSEFDTARVAFRNQLKGLSDSIRVLSDNASANSDLLNNDLRAVNDQLNVVFNLLADRIIDVQEFSIEELYEDVADDQLDTITTGRVETCTNKGIVKGDINVGGIAGSMSIDDEDPEDSAAGKVEYKVGRRYITKCLLTDSVNEGYVTAKKDGAGGICGYMNHGIIAESKSFGSVESTEGGYVGGICGQSFTIIKRCYALCSVSGGSNIGGIAGYADAIQDCYAMASVKAEKGRAGAIAGQIAAYEIPDRDAEEAELKVSGNYYVGSDVYGIDNISYVGVAEPISYNELLTVEHLPLQFWHLKVIYRIEDLILGTQEIPYGERLDHLDYPGIPDKEGFYGVWPDVSERIMEGTYVVQGEYKENVTVVKSEGGEAVDTAESVRIRPYALVSDVFTEDAVLNAAVSDFAPPIEAEGREHVVYEISITDSGLEESDSFAVRILNPYEKAVVYAYKNGSWTELESKVRGQYLQVEMTGTQEYFCVVEQSSNTMVIVCIAAGAAAVFAVLLLLVRKARAHRRKKADRKSGLS